MTRPFPTALLDPRHRPTAAQLTASYRTTWRRGGTVTEPNRFFDSRWYALHNIDWQFCETPFDHYLQIGLSEGRDPSPYVEFSVLRRRRPAPSNRALYERLVATGAGPSDGVYTSVQQLRDVQQRLLGRIRPYVLRPAPSTKRPNLVFIQNRASPRIREWTAATDRSFDVLANHYDTRCLDSSRDADIRVVQVGTKFTAVAAVTRTDPDLLAGYRHIMLLDDDIALSAGQLEAAFAEVEPLGASLAQPGLTADSECSWPDLFADTATAGALRTNTVEVMMPIFAGRFFERAKHTFGLSVSGFGLDLLWGSLLGPDESAWRLGTVTARHEQPVDKATGQYYEFLRRNHINPRSELWALIDGFGLRRSIRRWPTTRPRSDLASESNP